MTCQRHRCDQTIYILRKKKKYFVMASNFFSTKKCKRFWLGKGSPTYIIYNFHAASPKRLFLILNNIIILVNFGYKKKQYYFLASGKL